MHPAGSSTTAAKTMPVVTTWSKSAMPVQASCCQTDRVILCLTLVGTNIPLAKMPWQQACEHPSSSLYEVSTLMGFDGNTVNRMLQPAVTISSAHQSASETSAFMPAVCQP